MSEAPGERGDIDNHSLYQELCSSRPTDTHPRPDSFTTRKGWKRLQDSTAGTLDSLLYVGLTRATDRLIALIESATFRKALGGTA